MHAFIQICCCGHIRGDPCLVVYGCQGVGSFHVTAAASAGNIGVGWGELSMELHYHSHYSSNIEAVLVVDRHSVRAVVDVSPH